MSETFSVGEVCVVVNSIHAGDNGHECTILAPLSTHTGTGLSAYRISFPKDPVRTWATPECLRKKRPPPQREATSTWDDLIVWRPKETVHV